MRNLADTIHRLASQRAVGQRMGLGNTAIPDRLSLLENFGSNPAMLAAKIHIPARMAQNAPLVVTLHGCTQSAASYAEGAGWVRLADEYGFALLLPEQQRSNNPNLCFNWFVPENCRRDAGEALSIRQMIGAMVARYGIDQKRIFINGLSAGGAMTSAMLATYPEIFAGGGVIAGLPFACAGNVPEAFDRMRGHGLPGEHALQNSVRNASQHQGPWPTISVWHGTSDQTVAPENADAVVTQWRGVNGLGPAPTRTSTGEGWSRRVWTNAEGRDLIEEYRIAGMGHGTPITTGGRPGDGIAGPFILDVGLSSTLALAASWKLVPAVNPVARADIDASEASRPKLDTHQDGSITKTIEDALRAAGLMRR